MVDISGIEGRDPFEDFVKINEELKNYSVKLWDRPQIVVANKTDMLYDEEVFENFKKKVQELGFDKVFKEMVLMMLLRKQLECLRKFQ